MSDPREPARGHMQEESPDELLVVQGHGLLPALVLVVLVGEGCLPGSHLDKPVVGNGGPVCVAAQIPVHPFGTLEGLLAVDNPLLAHDGIQKGIEPILCERDVTRGEGLAQG